MRQLGRFLCVSSTHCLLRCSHQVVVVLYQAEYNSPTIQRTKCCCCRHHRPWSQSRSIMANLIWGVDSACAAIAFIMLRVLTNQAANRISIIWSCQSAPSCRREFRGLGAAFMWGWLLSFLALPYLKGSVTLMYTMDKQRLTAAAFKPLSQ